MTTGEGKSGKGKSATYYKRMFLQCILRTIDLTPEAEELVDFLVDNSKYLKNIRIVPKGYNLTRGILINKYGEVYRAWEGVLLKDVGYIKHIIKSSRDTETLLITLPAVVIGFPFYEQALEESEILKPAFIPKKSPVTSNDEDTDIEGTYVEVTDGMISEIYLRMEIDKAIDSGNKDLFMQLSKQLGEMTE